MNDRLIVRRRHTMPAKPGFVDYLKAAFNARPFGMFVAPNWIGLGAFAMLGALNPGFWVLGAGLELGYLLMLATNPRFQRLIAARPLSDSTREWNTRIQKLLTRLDTADRRSYDALAERCRSIIDLQLNTGVGEPHGLEAQADSLGRLSWMYLRLLVARQTLKQVLGASAVGDLTRRITALERQHEDTQTGDELRRSLAGQIEILTQRLQQRADAERKLTYIDAELDAHRAAGRTDSRTGRALDRPRVAVAPDRRDHRHARRHRPMDPRSAAGVRRDGGSADGTAAAHPRRHGARVAVAIRRRARTAKGDT